MRDLARCFILLAVSLACAIGHSSAVLAASRDAPKPLNFIFILVDDWGWTDAGCLGSDLYETPHIDQLAKDGVRFTHGYSACTVCSPTRAAVMTGKYPARLHLTDWITGHRRKNAKLRIPDWTMHLEHKEVTLAEALAAAGYRTCHVGKWHLGDEPYWPLKQGFDENFGGYSRGQPSYFSPYHIPTLKDGPKGEYLTDREAEEACGFIERNRDQPFFIYLAHYCVHTPLQAKQDVIEKYRNQVEQKGGARHRNPTYAAMVESVDDCLGRVRAKLEEYGLADRTVIVLTGDNGGLAIRNGPTDNYPLRAGKGSSYEGGTRVPLFVLWPGGARPGSVSDTPAISCDYYPTILEMAGVAGDAAHNAHVDGVSLTSVLQDPKTRLDRAIYWHYPHYHPGGATPYGAVREGDYKLIEFYEDHHVELYNLVDDIGEKNDLAESQPQLAACLKEKLAAWRKSVDAQMPTPNPSYKP